ncbi:ABC transporter permease [Actinospica robiniae]|uniref:ABC transporter permease n=1 Tax=Actinospica robiniae TaxID=304901 RepID=UPI0003F6E8DE|nr:FtsX-like permease family protein [Actinospica robiniae]
MERLSIVFLILGAMLGWLRLLRAGSDAEAGTPAGAQKRFSISWRWLAIASVVAVGLSFLPDGAKQGMSMDWLVGVVGGAYARAVRDTGRWDVWKRDSTEGEGEDREGGSPTQTKDPADRTTPRASARRAMLRWAWRLFRREWRQHVIVSALITLAVAGTVVGSAVAVDASPPSNQGFGSANHAVQLAGGDPRLADDLAALRSRFGTLDVIENRNLDTGLSQGAELRTQDPDGGYGRPMLSLVSGSYPTAAGQIAVTGSLADTLGLHVGGVWHENGDALSVVGIVQDPLNLDDEFALAGPGRLGPGAALGPADTVTVLFDASPAELAAGALPDGMTAQAPQASSGITPEIIVLAVAVLALVFTGLVAVAGFAALARRRQRALGMLAALGATERDIRLTVMADGAFTGALGAVLGTGLGLAAWIAYAPRFSRNAGHLVPWTAVPWWLLVCVAILAVVCATTAAWRPAHAVARMPIVSALSDRPAPPVAIHRSVTPPLVLLIGAPVLLATSGGWGAQGGRAAFFQLGGLLLSALGLALAAPFAVARLAGPARRLPPAAKLALRDLSRYRVRSAAALAAGSLAVLIAVLVTLITTGRYSDPIDYFGPNLPSDQLVVYAPNDGPGTGRGPNGGSPAQDTAALTRHATAIAAMLGSRDVLALQPVAADLMHKTPQKTSGDSGSLFVATPALLAHYGIDPHSIQATTMLITSRPGLQGLSGLFLLYGDFSGPDGRTAQALNPSVQTLSALPTDTADPNLLVSEHAVHSLELTVEPTSAWLIQAPQPLTALQINSARQMALAAGMTVEVRSEAPSLAEVRDDATVAGILIALGVLAMMVGLIRAESAGDLRILTASGARGRTRRGITATTAGVLALLAAVGGTVIAYVDTVAFFGIEALERLREVPGTDLLLVLLALPAAATAGGWLFAGREQERLGRTRIE